MEKCENSCDTIIGEIVLPILTGCLSVGSHSCAELQIRFWTIYLEALEKMLKACDIYYNKLAEDLADQNGKLPLAFLSSPYRSLYRNLLKEKIEAIWNVTDNFVGDLESSSMKEFRTRCSWEQQHRDNPSEKSQKIDEDCRKLIKSLTEWTKIIKGSRLSEINKKRKERLETVFELLRIVVESLAKEYEKVERYFSKERQQYFTWLLSNIRLAYGVKSQMRLIEMDDVVSLTTGIILMWRHVRIMQSRVNCSYSAGTLPLALRSWVLKEKSMMNNCRPGMGDGRRRAMGILSGLTYAWLQERCNEWKAEIASQELLTSFDYDHSSKSITKPGPSGKSNKKNKKKNKISSPPTNGSSPRPTTNSVNNGSEMILTGEIEHGQGEKDDICITNGTSNTVENDREGYTHLIHEHYEETESYGSMVVVQDESGSIIPAMDFLTDRLAELMREPEDDNILIVPI